MYILYIYIYLLNPLKLSIDEQIANVCIFNNIISIISNT